MKNEERIWGEIRSDYTEDETGITHIDAWVTGDDDEEGKTIATIDDFGNVKYVDERAKSDQYAQEVIQEKIREKEDERHELVDQVIEQLKKDFAVGDYTVIDEILVHNVSMKVLRASLPEE